MCILLDYPCKLASKGLGQNPFGDPGMKMGYTPLPAVAVPGLAIHVIIGLGPKPIVHLSPEIRSVAFLEVGIRESSDPKTLKVYVSIDAQAESAEDCAPASRRTQAPNRS